MIASTKPRSALLAYCALADRLNKPGAGIAQALTPFLAEVCQPFAGEFFDAAMFSSAVSEKYGIRIPRLAALGLAEHLEKEGLLTAVTGHAKSTAYRYSPAKLMSAEAVVSSVTEAEIDAVLNSFVEFCRADAALGAQTDTRLQSAFFERLLNADSMRLLSRREMSNAAKKGSETLLLKKPVIELEPHEREELHLDFLVSQYLLDLRDSNPTGFERVSDIAFANMAAEALAVFREPLTEHTSLSTLTVYLDSPLLLDMLGVNTEYSDYGQELLRAIKSSGATPAIFDHCVAEAESVVGAQLARLRSGINQMTNGWGTSAKPDLLSALVGCVGARASNRLGIAVHRDPEVNLHRRSPVAVGDIEADLVNRMQAWRNADSRDHDRKSVWECSQSATQRTPVHASVILDFSFSPETRRWFILPMTRGPSGLRAQPDIAKFTSRSGRRLQCRTSSLRDIFGSAVAAATARFQRRACWRTVLPRYARART